MAVTYNYQTGQYEDDSQAGAAPGSLAQTAGEYTGQEGLRRIAQAYADAGHQPTTAEMTAFGINPSKEDVDQAINEIFITYGGGTKSGATTPNPNPNSGPASDPNNPNPNTNSGGSFQDFWNNWSGFDLSAAVTAWNAAHPTDPATMGTGSKHDKVTYRGQMFDGIIAAGSAGQQKAWNPIGAGGGAGGGNTATAGNAIDPSYLAPYTGTFTPGQDANLPQLPNSPGQFNYQDFKAPGGFQAPTADSIKNDPSFQLRRDQGRDVVLNGAFARGLGGSSGTLQDVIDYGENFASQEYGNIWNRDFSVWNQDYSHALDSWNSNRNNAFQNWNANNAVTDELYQLGANRSNTAYNRAWSQFQGDQDLWFRNQDSPFKKISTLASIGAGAAV